MSSVTQAGKQRVTEAPPFNPKSPFRNEPFIYRIFYGSQGIDQPLVHDVCEERGWREFGEAEKRHICGGMLGWNLFWRTSTLNVNPMRTLYSWQYTNFIPRVVGFVSKEYLRHFFTQLKQDYGAISDFGPMTFIIPGEWEALKKEDGLRKQIGESSDDYKILRTKNLVTDSEVELASETNPKKHVPLWITKPVGRSQGKGIVITGDIKTLLTTHAPTVVQEYIARPLLIGGYKFDLRLYVCITSTNPVTMYVYQEGLTRFATQKYDLNDLHNHYSHLTNASLNKLGEAYKLDKEHIGFGCKWSLEKLRRYFSSRNIPDFYLWQRIWSIIAITLVGECNKIAPLPMTRNCFAFLGYDILIDENMRPYLLEVNLAPGLNADSEVDTAVKKPMLHDLFNLIGLPRRAPRPRTATGTNVRRPQTSTGIPNSYSRPSTAGRGMGLIANQNRHKFGEGTPLRQRLLDMTAIYSQDLTANMRLTQKNNTSGKKRTGSNEAEQCSFQPRNGKPAYSGITRNWAKPLKSCGGWIRVFPFDELSHLESRTKTVMDHRLMVSRLYAYLQEVRDIVLECPGKADQFYIDHLEKKALLNTGIWVPPTQVVTKPDAGLGRKELVLHDSDLHKIDPSS